MLRSRTLARSSAIAMAGLLALGAAACGGDDDGDAAGDTATTETTAPSDETTTTAAPDDGGGDADETTTTALSDEGNTAIEQLAQSTLIVPSDLTFAAFQDVGYTPSPGPNQCGNDIDATHPSEVLVGTRLGTDTLQLLEEIRVYRSADAAEAAFDAGIDGTQCTPEDGTRISAPTDLTEQVGAKRAVGVSATNPDVNVIVVAALLDDAVVSFTFAAAPGAAEAAGAPDPADVAAFGVGKIKAALEAIQGQTGN